MRPIPPMLPYLISLDSSPIAFQNGGLSKFGCFHSATDMASLSYPILYALLRLTLNRTLHSSCHMAGVSAEIVECFVHFERPSVIIW